MIKTWNWLGTVFLLAFIMVSAPSSANGSKKAHLTLHSQGQRGANICSKGIQNCSINVTQNTGCQAQPGSVTITNNSRVPAKNIRAASSNSNFNTYIIQNNHCPESLAPGAQCRISFYTNAAVAFFISNITVRGSNTNTLLFDMNAYQCLSQFTVGGSVSGLSGTLVLQNNGADPTSINSDGPFTFAVPDANGSPYNVTILSQPTTQTCSVTNGSGIISGANVTSITVTCVNNTYTVGGAVSGLSGSVVLQNNGSDPLLMSADGSFTFATPLPSGTSYNVTVQTQPATQTCTVGNGTGVIGSADVTNITVSCSTNTYTVGGSVSGLSGTVVLQNNGADSTSISSDGPFTFAMPVADGSTYNVTVLSQPLTQTCSVSNGSGTLSGTNVNNVTVTCSTNTYTVGGTVSGLSGSVVLQNNGGDSTVINGDGPFNFAVPVADGSPYNVTIQSQPATQTCIISNGSGTISGANVTDVAVSCTTNTYTIGGTVSGLVGTVVLQNNGADTTPISSDGSFTFPTPLNDGTPYNVTVLTQPATQTCLVTNGTGTLSGSNVTNVAVNCSSGNTTVSIASHNTIAVNAGTTMINITNTGPTYSAYNVSLALPVGWTAVNQDASGCTAIAPGSSCNLSFTSTAPYIAANNIAVTGDNLSSPPTTAIAFTMSGYLVFSVDTPSSATVVDSANVATSHQWGNVGVQTNAQDFNNGLANTTMIMGTPGVGVTAAASCYNSTNGGAAVGSWYLPALCQMGGQTPFCTIDNIDRLYQLGFINLPLFAYWSSTESTSTSTIFAYVQRFSAGIQQGNDKSSNFAVRCVRSLSY